MNERNLLLCDAEISYAERLGEQISKREDLSVKVYVCSSFEHALQLSSEREIHMLVIDETYSYEERNQLRATQSFVLVREHGSALGEREHPIYKYQCADGIIREIFEVYVEKTNENIMRNLRKERPKLIAVYSPVHRVGKTTFAIALGKEMAKKRRVLYLNLEEFSGFTEEEGYNLGDILYYMKQGNGTLSMKVQTSVRQMEELCYIPPVPLVTDLREVTSLEWELLLEELLQNSTYERIILDLGESVQGLYSILKLCDRIYMPSLREDAAERKIHQYVQSLERMQLTKLESITHRFVMPPQIEEYAKLRAKEEI